MLLRFLCFFCVFVSFFDILHGQWRDGAFQKVMLRYFALFKIFASIFVVVLVVASSAAVARCNNALLV